MEPAIQAHIISITDSVIRIGTADGRAFSDNVYLNINTDANVLTDCAVMPNSANDNNRRVRVMTGARQIDSTESSSSEKGGGCGAGTILALLWPLGLKFRIFKRGTPRGEPFR